MNFYKKKGKWNINFKDKKSTIRRELFGLSLCGALAVIMKIKIKGQVDRWSNNKLS